MVKELFFINYLSIVPKYYITSKTSLLNNKNIYTFLFPQNIDKPTIKIYLSTLFNIKINSINVINLKDKKYKKVIITSNNKILNIFN
nr:ribosomal protein L23 [Coccidia sp. AB-2023a]